VINQPIRDAPTPSTDIRDLHWSPAEKLVARKAFDAALQRELDAVVREAKAKAARIRQPSELWELERYLTERRKEIDEGFDFRYSVLPLDFARLLRQGLLREEELRGLNEEKMYRIRQIANG
jgi:Photoprotection regulator fluorescence recovery protein